MERHPFETVFLWGLAGMAIATLAIAVVAIVYYSIHRYHPKLSFFHPAVWFPTFFGVGKAPIVPGTWGSYAGLMLIAGISILPRYGLFNPLWLLPILLASTLIITLVGIKLSDIYASTVSKPDPSEVVVDEVAGMFLAVCTFALCYTPLIMHNEMRYAPLLTMMPYYMFTLFVLFRIFDIWKPGPIGWCDSNLKGGLGIMLDDIVAGLFAGISLFLLVLGVYHTGLLAKIVHILYPNVTIL